MERQDNGALESTKSNNYEADILTICIDSSDSIEMIDDDGDCQVCTTKEMEHEREILRQFQSEGERQIDISSGAMERQDNGAVNSTKSNNYEADILTIGLDSSDSIQMIDDDRVSQVCTTKEMEHEREILRQFQSEGERQIDISSGIVAHTVDDIIETDSRSVFVGNVDYSATAVDLKVHFDGCGPVKRITIQSDQYSGHPKGFAYIEFSEMFSVNKALALDKSLFRGRQLKVMTKRTNRPGISSTNPYTWISRGLGSSRISYFGRYHPARRSRISRFRGYRPFRTSRISRFRGYRPFRTSWISRFRGYRPFRTSWISRFRGYRPFRTSRISRFRGYRPRRLPWFPPIKVVIRNDLFSTS